MSNYNESVTEGSITQWTRSPRMILDNPIDSPPSAMVYITEAKRYPDNTTSEQSTGSVNYTLTDPAVEIPYIDPDTYEATETTFTAGEFWLQAASVALWLMRQGETPVEETP